MQKMIRSVFSVALVLCGLVLAQPASAQVTTNPQTASFTLDDASFATITAVHLDFFSCTSLSPAGLCNGQATQPLQAGVDIPKASVLTLSPVDQFGNNRKFSLTTSPVNGLLTSVPIGAPFVAEVNTVGDPNQGMANSDRSAASAPFFSGLKKGTAPQGLRLQ